ncbi:MAG: hypothetical protein AB1714_01510 [Acidobacteriota bacterium]
MRRPSGTRRSTAVQVSYDRPAVGGVSYILAWNDDDLQLTTQTLFGTLAPESTMHISWKRCVTELDLRDPGAIGLVELALMELGGPGRSIKGHMYMDSSSASLYR